MKNRMQRALYVRLCRKADKLNTVRTDQTMAMTKLQLLVKFFHCHYMVDLSYESFCISENGLYIYYNGLKK